MQKSHESDSHEGIRDKNTGTENGAVEKDFSALLSCKAEIGDKENDGGDGTGGDNIDETCDQYSRKAPSLESLVDAFFSFFLGFVRHLLPGGRCSSSFIL